MRCFLILILVVSTSVAHASDVLKLFVPSPASVVITIGRWILENRSDPIYEVSVQGAGWTESEARDQAFKLAVNDAIGSLVLSQSEVVNREVARNIVVNYSSGYVHKFKEIGRRTDTDGRLLIQYKVWVKRSTLADGLFGESRDTAEIPGQQIAASLRSLQDEQNQGDALLESVLRNFPEQAFDIANSRISMRLDNQRQASLWVEFDLAWHGPYLDSLGQALAETSQVGRKDPCALYSVGCSSTTFYARITRDYRNRNVQQGIYRDQSRWMMVKKHLLDSWPVVRIQVLDGRGATIHDGCYGSPYLNAVAAGTSDRYSGGMVEISNPGLIAVVGWARPQLKIRVAQNFTADQLDFLDSVIVTVVPGKTCALSPAFAA